MLISGHAFSSEEHLLPLSSEGLVEPSSLPLPSLRHHHNLAGSYPHLSHPDLIKDTVTDSIHTVQTEALRSRTFCPQRSDEQEGRTGRHLAPAQEGDSEEQEGEESRLLTWLQTGLYLSPGLFRIFSSCLWLKLDTPMDLVSPASLHFSRAWEGGVVSSHSEWAREQ